MDSHGTHDNTTHFCIVNDAPQICVWVCRSFSKLGRNGKWLQDLPDSSEFSGSRQSSLQVRWHCTNAWKRYPLSRARGSCDSKWQDLVRIHIDHISREATDFIRYVRCNEHLRYVAVRCKNLNRIVHWRCMLKHQEKLPGKGVALQDIKKA